MILTNEMLSFPQMAPLSTPMVLHLLNVNYQRVQDIFANKEREQPRYTMLQENINRLTERIREARYAIFGLLEEALETQVMAATASVRIQWFQEHLAQQLYEQAKLRMSHVERSVNARTYSASNNMIAKLRKSNLLRPSTPYQPLERDCVAAILIAARVDGRLQGFLPSFIEVNEPFWTCYLQRSQIAPVEVCVYPLPDTLPAGAVVWSPWCPADDPYWKDFGVYGGIRFTDATISSKGVVRWTIAKKQLEAFWSSGFSSLDVSLVMDRGFWGDKLIHGYADTILTHLAESRLVAQ